MPSESTASLSGPKRILLGVWALCALAFLGPADSGAATLGTRIFWVLVAAHAVECLVFLPKLRRAPGPLGSHLVQTFVFGILHVRDLSGSQAAGDGSGT